MEHVTWYTRERRCKNGITFKTKFPARTGENMRKGSKRKTAAIRRAEKNVREAKVELAIALNNNFRAGEDFYIGLDYDAEGLARLIAKAGTDDPDALYLAAKKEAENFILRCRRACKAAGVPFRYVYVTSDRDGFTLEAVRVHHHVVVNREAAEICAAKWTAGGVWVRPLFGGVHGDLTPLAEYMIAQVRQIGTEKRYTPSRNLERAEVSPLHFAPSPEAEIRTPPGCDLIWRAETTPGRPQMIRYYRPPDGAELEQESGKEREHDSKGSTG